MAENMHKHMSYFNFSDALKEQGCSICLLLQKTIHKLMGSFLYEQVNDSASMKEIRESLGFCSRHAWQLQKFGDGFALSIIYENLMGIAAGHIEKMALSGKYARKFFRRFLKIKGSFKETNTLCPVCRVKKETEARYISIFIESFYEPEFHSCFEDSFGLCLPHLAAVIESCNQGRIIKELLSMEVQKFNKLIEELKEFQRKHDYRFSQEDFKKEGNSWIRAIEKLAGKEE